MTHRPIEVRPIAGALGAEIDGVDLSADLSEAAFAEIHRAFLEYLVIFFRGQRLDPGGLAAFARRFGPLASYPFVEPLKDHPKVVEIIKEPEQETNFGGCWHSDTSYLEIPPLGTLLYGRQVPPVGGDTLFANMYLAYDRLSTGMKALLEPLVAVNSAARVEDRFRVSHLKDGAMKGRLGEEEAFTAEHPVIRTHPATGRKAIYVNRAHSVRFKGMTEAESAPLLDFLFAHATREEFTCRFRWEEGSLTLWDNRCTQHYPLNDYAGHRRVMQRITVEGERPV